MTPDIRNKVLLVSGLAFLSLVLIVLSIYTILSNQSTPTPNARPTPTVSIGISPSRVVPTSQAPSISPHPDRELEFQQGAKEIQENYPWLSKLPIKSDQYFVYFNTNTKTFIARLYVPEDQVQNVQTEIITRLRSLNIPVDQFTISYSVSPQ